MAIQTILEAKYFGDVGRLYPYDIRHEAHDVAYCNPLPDGRVLFRLVTEHGFAEAVLVYNDGTAQGAPLAVTARDSRFLWWETVIRPASPLVTYSFALRRDDGSIIYHCKHGVDHAVEPLDRWVLDLKARRVFTPPAWMQGAIVYQIFPDRFANGDRASDPQQTAPWGSPPAWLEFQGGDLPGVTQRLDYLQDLGVDVVYLNPINVSPSTHKYDAVDFFHVDPGFGGDAALRELVTELHRRGMRILLDASFNHCHPRFFAFQDLLKHGTDSRYRDWFTIYEYPVKVRYRPHLLSEEQRRQMVVYLRWLRDFSTVTGVPLEEMAGEGPVFEPGYLAWYGVLDMPKLNQRNPETRAYFLDIATYWLREFDIDGWRMDVARHIESDFWVDFRRACKAVRPDCFLLAEIWGNVAPWLQGDQFDATMNYIFRDLCVAYFAQGSLGTGEFLDGLTRTLHLYAPQVAAVTHNLLSSHDVERFRTAAGGDVERLKLATLFQLTMPGAPGIYYGDEIGMLGGDDPDCRGAFPWDEPAQWDQGMLDLTRALGRLRHAYAPLRYGAWRLVWAGAEAFAYERAHEGHRVLVVINRGPLLERLELPVAAPAPVVIWGQATVTAAGSTLAIHGLPACSGVVVDLA